MSVKEAWIGSQSGRGSQTIKMEFVSRSISANKYCFKLIMNMKISQRLPPRNRYPNRTPEAASEGRIAVVELPEPQASDPRWPSRDWIHGRYKVLYYSLDLLDQSHPKNPFRNRTRELSFS